MKSRRVGFLLMFLPGVLPWMGILLSRMFDKPLWAGMTTLVVLFVFLPVLDFFLGNDCRNPDEQQTRQWQDDPYFKWLTLLCIPLQFCNVIVGAHYAATFAAPLPWFIWALSLGIASGLLAINVAHELIHKNTRLEQWGGGFLLSSVCYGGFKIEHIRGHHVHVSTPHDASSAVFNQSLFCFLPQAVLNNSRNAVRLQREYLTRQQLSFWHARNEWLWWTGISVTWLITFFVLFGLNGFLFFIVQSVVAILLLETINYIEHYGLHRQKRDDGHYERVTHRHSWNSSASVSNLVLLHLQRHSDHHAFPKRRYQVLRHFDDSPQLPAGYAAMVLLAWCPPLWRKIMNPRVARYYESENTSSQLAGI